MINFDDVVEILINLSAQVLPVFNHRFRPFLLLQITQKIFNFLIIFKNKVDKEPAESVGEHYETIEIDHKTCVSN